MKSLMYALLCLLVSIGMITAQTTTVRGTVIFAEDGEPVIGASIVVKGTTVGTVTHVDGTFTLDVPANARTLQISYVGMMAQEVAIAPNVRVVMQADTRMIDEVMVVAYGTAKKSSFTGSAAVVKKENIEKIQTASLTKALEGSAPGLQVTSGTGQPGSNSSIRIRGFGSINASNTPLYVVDGAPFDGDINTINPIDIENITVLKDATSAALYGARGANGVIIVTTKKGVQGKTKLNARVTLGLSDRAIPEYDRVGIGEYYELMWEGYRNALVIANKFTPQDAAATASSGAADGIVGKLGGYNSYNVGNGELVGTDGKLNPNARLLYYDDWSEALFHTALRQDYNVSVSGGNDNNTYFASVSYLNEDGIAKWSNYERFSGRVGLTSQVNSWLKVDASLSGTSSNQAGFLAEGTYTTNPFFYSRAMAPIYPIWQREADGSIKKAADGSPMYDMGGGSTEYTWPGHLRANAPNSNLMLTLPLDERSNDITLLSARVSAEIKFLKDFTLKVSGNTDIQNRGYIIYQNNKYGDAQGVLGRSTKEKVKINSYTFNQILTWNKTFGEHTISALAGHENYQRVYEYMYATRTGFTIPNKELVAGSVAEGSSSYTSEYAVEGFPFQVNYDYSSKYYLSGSLRYDGSSRFYKDTRWGSFWSLGGSWRISEEDFIKDRPWVDDLKLKASYGQQGNDGLLSGDENNYYGWQGLFSIDDRNNANRNGALYAQLENRNLQWEKNANLNVGLEFSLFTRLRGTLEFFNRESSNLLFEVPRPESTGINSMWQNIGTMRNRGFEISLSGDIVATPNFKWTMDVNATALTNKITKMPLDSDGKPQEIIDENKKLSEGHSLYEFWLRDYVGVDPQDGSALYNKDILDSDGNVTGVETTKDQNAASYYYKGDAIADLFGSITNTLTYKDFSLSIFTTYQVGGKIYDYNYAWLMHPGTFGTHWSTDIRNRWQKAGDVTDVPRLQNNYTAASAPSSRYITDASYFSIRNVTFTYNLPKSFLSKLDILDMKVFASGDNLGLFCARKGMDPQQSFTGNADNTYSLSRVFSLGINVTF